MFSPAAGAHRGCHSGMRKRRIILAAVVLALPAMHFWP